MNNPFELIEAKLEIIEKLLLDIKHKSIKVEPSEQSEQLLTVNDLSKFLKLQKSTIYGYVHNRKIPYIKRGKVLYFEKSEILSWLKTYRQKTDDEIKEEINNII